MLTKAVVLREPRALSLEEVTITPASGDAGRSEIRLRTAWSGVSAGTERLLWDGRMPDFPGMGYPLVPGYETVGEVVEAGPDSGFQRGDWAFVPGANCYADVRGLFGGASACLTADGGRAVKIDSGHGAEGALLALAATAYHALSGSIGVKPDLIVGHGALGRLLARLSVAMGGPPPTVWEQNPARRGGAEGTYVVTTPEEDPRRDYAAVYDVSGDGSLLDALIARLQPGGEVVLAGFYNAPLSFAFPPAFMREARLRVAAEWRPSDLAATRDLVESGRLSLAGLITHRAAAADAAGAYVTAFEDPDCLKMVLDWSAQ